MKNKYKDHILMLNQMLNLEGVEHIGREVLNLPEERIKELYKQANDNFKGTGKSIKIKDTYDWIVSVAKTPEEKEFMNMFWANYDAAQQILKYLKLSDTEELLN